MIYLVVQRDETGQVSETRVLGKELAKHIDNIFRFTDIQILAIVRLTNNE